MKENKTPEEESAMKKAQPGKVKIRQLPTGVRGLDEGTKERCVHSLVLGFAMANIAHPPIVGYGSRP